MSSDVKIFPPKGKLVSQHHYLNKLCFSLSEISLNCLGEMDSVLDFVAFVPVRHTGEKTQDDFFFFFYLPVLCSCFPLSIYFTFGSVYICQCYSHFIPAYPSPSPCPQVCSLLLHLYSCPAPRFIRTFLLYFWIPYICVSIWYLFSSF